MTINLVKMVKVIDPVADLMLKLQTLINNRQHLSVKSIGQF